MTPRGIIQTLTGWLGKPIAGPDTDPQRFFGTLYALPNPDPILRGMGEADRVYASIAADPHVLGDIRSIRGNFRAHAYRLVEGDEGNAQSAAALQLCQDWIERTRPNPMNDWMEVMWQMASAFMSGYRAHELVWDLQGGKYLPSLVADRPGRRFRFSTAGEPLLISRGNMLGAPVEPYQFVISRHMATYDNPYGVAVMSALFWPWTFKTGGWRAFVRYCERHGLPWPVARYPIGTPDKDQEALAKALESMIESAYAVVQEGTGIELLEPNSTGGQLPQDALIDRSNREMSKALTGQAMVSELQGTGARAASETALKRQESIDDSVRDIAADTMGAIFRWITLFNFGDGVAPPTLELFKQVNAGKDRADTYQTAADMGARPSKSAMLEELGIPVARDDEDALLPRNTTTSALVAAPANPAAVPGKAPAQAKTDPTQPEPTKLDLSGIPGFEFARAAGMTEDEAIQLASDAADSAIEDHLIAPIATMLAQFEADGKTLAEFKTSLEGLVGQMDDDALREVLDRALSYAILRGAATRAA